MDGHVEEHLSPEEKCTILDFIILAPITPSKDLISARDAGIVKELLDEAAYLIPYHDMMTAAEDYIKRDDKVEFNYLLENEKELVHNFPAQNLFYLICQGNAPGCAAAFLDSGFHVDLNEPFMDGYYPLQYAAEYLSYDLTHILLQHGANPNVRVNTDDHLLLAVALDALCNNEYAKQWNGEKSIFKLFYLLCLPALKEPLDTIRLLAVNTEKQSVYSKLIRLIERRNHGCSESFLQLIALLMVEKDNWLVPSADAGGSFETTPLGQLFSNRISIKESKELYNHLETFWRAIDVLEHYRTAPSVKSISKRQLPFDIARALTNEAKLELKPEDVYCHDIDCLRPMLSNSNAKDLEKQMMQDHVGSSLSSSSLSQSRWKPVICTSWQSSPSIPSSPDGAFRKFHTNANFNMKNLVQVQLSKTMPKKPASHTGKKICAPLIWIAKRSPK